METRNIKITEETALRWKNGTDNELKELAKMTFPELFKKELPKSWNDLKVVSGYYPTSDSTIKYSTGVLKCLTKNNFATEEQAKASIALSQLSQLKAVYNDGWIADWSNPNTNKYCIEFVRNTIGSYIRQKNNAFLSFKDAETRDLFLENFSDLILQAKSLLS
jgi:hypothetical protein